MFLLWSSIILLFYPCIIFTQLERDYYNLGKFARLNCFIRYTLHIKYFHNCIIKAASYFGRCACILSSFSCGQLFVTPWHAACQAPLSMGFSRPGHWSGLPCPPPGDLPHPGTEPRPLMSPALASGFFTTSATWEAHVYTLIICLVLQYLDYFSMTNELQLTSSDIFPYIYFNF